ncbi:hypothetical protein [Paraflavitalea speifideaquila]|uniref:hypothetical protein n=1 Tax=Paraflavitalea speifideaquila TaxID=3076558 RepID=UPI0028EBA968|nr:hypothetical protein [Paraflavitalea speifideiaquila]
MKSLISGALLLLLMQTTFAQETPIKDEQLNGLIQSAITNYPRIKELEEQLRADDVKKRSSNPGTCLLSMQISTTSLWLLHLK